MVFAGYSGFLHHIQLASHEIATFGLNVTKSKIPNPNTLQSKANPHISEPGLSFIVTASARIRQNRYRPTSYMRGNSTQYPAKPTTYPKSLAAFSHTSNRLQLIGLFARVGDSLRKQGYRYNPFKYRGFVLLKTVSDKTYFENFP